MFRTHHMTMLTLILGILLIAPNVQANHHEKGEAGSKGKASQMAETGDEAEAKGKKAKKSAKKRAKKESDAAGEVADEAGEHLEDADEDAAEEADGGAGDQAQGTGDEIEDSAQAESGGRGGEMRDRRDERKKIMSESRAEAEPGTPRKGKKPWYRFWDTDDE